MLSFVDTPLFRLNVADSVALAQFAECPHPSIRPSKFLPMFLIISPVHPPMCIGIMQIGLSFLYPFFTNPYHLISLTPRTWILPLKIPPSTTSLSTPHTLHAHRFLANLHHPISLISCTWIPTRHHTPTCPSPMTLTYLTHFSTFQYSYPLFTHS